MTFSIIYTLINIFTSPDLGPACLPDLNQRRYPDAKSCVSTGNPHRNFATQTQNLASLLANPSQLRYLATSLLRYFATI